jgi:aromatic amino acid aminotransferase I / 2-aminoadipate transaminase
MAPFMDESKISYFKSDQMGSDGVFELKIPEGNTRRKAMDWSGYLTDESAARRPSALKAAFKHLDIPGIISLGGGLPLPAYFPIHEVAVKVPSVGGWSETETAAAGSEIRISKYVKPQSHQNSHRAICNGENDYSDTLSDGMANLNCSSHLGGVPHVPLATTLQYGLGTGEPNLVAFLKEHTRMVHNPSYEDWSTTLTCGNTYSFYTCLRMLVERGDYLIMEEFAYSSAISTCGPMGIKIVGIEMDEQGMTATGLDAVLSSWDIRVRGARKPRVVYLVPYISFQHN